MSSYPWDGLAVDGGSPLTMPPATDAPPWRESLLQRMLLVAIPAMIVALILVLATTERPERRYFLVPTPIGLWGLVALYRGRWPFALRAAGLIAPLGIGVVVTYFAFGFKGNASALATFVVVLTGLLFGRKRMTATVLIAFLIAAGIGAATIMGLLRPDPRHLTDLDRPLAWIRNDVVALLIWIALGSVVMFVVEHIEGALRGTREALAHLEAEQERRQSAEAERHRAQEALVRAQRTEIVTQLAAGVAHDFNNVLSVMSTWTTAALDEAASARDRETTRQALGRALQQGQALTRQLTALARPEARTPTRFRVDRPVRAAVETLTPAMPPGIELTFEAATAPEIVGDETEIQQVVYNLVLNARDAMPAGGTIRIAVAEIATPRALPVVGGTLAAGLWAALTVADSGTGIDPAIADRIFELFFTTKGPEHGTGLGLPTVARIAESHGGGVALESALGRGATFTVYLPVA